MKDCLIVKSCMCSVYAFAEVIWQKTASPPSTQICNRSHLCTHPASIPGEIRINCQLPEGLQICFPASQDSWHVLEVAGYATRHSDADTGDVTRRAVSASLC